MERTLNRRLLRDLKANFGRYLALFLMIVLGVYLVVGIVGASELVIIGTKNMKEVNKAEDGEFSVFAPLSDETLGRLTADGTYIEEMFSTDLAGEDGSTVRVFAVRKDIDLIVLDTGRTAENRARWLACSTHRSILTKRLRSGRLLRMLLSGSGRTVSLCRKAEEILPI